MPRSIPLPLELWLEIAGYLFYHEKWREHGVKLLDADEQNARRDLLACSKVSHVPRQAALPFLFHTLACRMNPKCAPLTCAWCGPTKLANRRCRQLEDLESLPESLPAICDLVCELRISIRPAGAPILLSGNALLRALRRFKKVRAIILVDADMRWDVQSLSEGETECSRDAWELESFTYRLQDTAFNERKGVSWSIIESILSELTSVETFTVSGGRFHKISAGTTRKCTVPAKVTSLEVNNLKGMEVLLASLNRTTAIQWGALTCLHFSYLSEGCSQRMSALLRHAGANLVQLSLELVHSYIFSANCKHTHRNVKHKINS